MKQPCKIDNQPNEMAPTTLEFGFKVLLCLWERLEMAKEHRFSGNNGSSWLRFNQHFRIFVSNSPHSVKNDAVAVSCHVQPIPNVSNSSHAWFSASRKNTVKIFEMWQMSMVFFRWLLTATTLQFFTTPTPTPPCKAVSEAVSEPARLMCVTLVTCRLRDQHGGHRAYISWPKGRLFPCKQRFEMTFFYLNTGLGYNSHVWACKTLIMIKLSVDT